MVNGIDKLPPSEVAEVGEAIVVGAFQNAGKKGRLVVGIDQRLGADADRTRRKPVLAASTSKVTTSLPWPAVTMKPPSVFFSVHGPASASAVLQARAMANRT